MRIRSHTVAMTNKLFSPKCLILLALTTAGTSLAATKISYEDIPKHLGVFSRVLEHRAIAVTTTDGKTHKGRRLQFASDHLTISGGNFHEDLPKADVLRIEIGQAGRFFHHVVEGAQLVAAAAYPGPEWSDVAIILLPPVLACAAATTPFFLAADGIAFFIPPKVYEIVH
jgi:hypothetical protein